MQFFKRSKSTLAKSTDRQQQTSSSPSSSSSSRPPLVSQTNIDHHPPKSPLSPLDNHLSSSNSSPLDNSQSKHQIGRKISHLDVEGSISSKTSQNSTSRYSEVQRPPGLTPPPRSSPRSPKSQYSDMYTHNDLQTFSFGAAPSGSSSSLSPSVDPLSRSRDEVDSDEISLMPDTTPRPSVVGGQHSRSHQSQSIRMEDWPPSLSASRVKAVVSPGEQAREPDSDATSIHTFGNSSASASVSSLSRPRGASSRATSRVSGHSSTTPLTSSNDMTSDDDDDMIGRHPLPPEPHQATTSHDLSSDQDYLSEEDFESDDEHGIEVDSVVNESSDRGTYYDYANSRDNFSMDQAGRRGSLAMAIPGTSSTHDQHSQDFAGGRRPSRSLEDLRHWTFEQGQGQSSESRPSKEYSIPIAPTSVPESEGDWRDLRKRSMQRDKDLPPVVLSPVAGPSSSGGSGTSPKGNSAMDGYDTSWLQPYVVNGVVGIDASEMTDIVGAQSYRGSISSFRKGSFASATRRQSTVSSSIDIMHRNIAGPWANEKYRDQRKMWVFVREKDRSEEAGPRHSSAVQDRERPSISSLFVPRPSTSTEDYSNVIAPFADKPESKEKERSTVTNKGKSKVPWKGMPLNSEEIWFNHASGKYKVMRRNAISVEAGKPPQQRLNITFIRSPYVFNATNREPADGPAVTIHKHSKAAAFSIGRHYRTKPAHGSATSPRDTTVSLRHGSAVAVSSKDSSDGTRKKGNMILLGTRKVQRAYTSTNTTRKLDTHGFLDDAGHTTSVDAERLKEDNQERQRRKNKEKEKKEKDKGDRSKDKRKTIDSPAAKRSKGDPKPKESKSKSVGSPSNALPDSSGSSAGSVFNAVSSGDSGTLVNATPVTTPDLTESTSSAGSVGSIEQSIMSQETTSSDRTVSRANLHRSHQRKHDIYDISDEDDMDDTPRYPTRTPHHEAYAALPPEVFESAHQENTHPKFFPWSRSKGGDRHGHRNNSYMQAAYKPPWPVTQPRHKTEDKKGIVEDLNSSFQDVGLLPAMGEIKGSSSHHSQSRRKKEQQSKKHVKRPSDKMQVDIFNDVPEEALYMLLPLWPGETDPQSAKRHPFSAPDVPADKRQYLMIYYKSDQPVPSSNTEEGGSKSKSGEKKRSQDNSPSGEPINERAILLSHFHITARVLAYRDLQGTGVRIPDAGLAVSGPLEDAFNCMPHEVDREANPRPDDYVLGVCHSRDSGVEFVPEAFDKLGLARFVPNPNPRPLDPSEDDDNSSFDTIPILTPLGRAVMEMAWLGSMALTSFNPNL